MRRLAQRFLYWLSDLFERWSSTLSDWAWSFSTRTKGTLTHEQIDSLIRKHLDLHRQEVARMFFKDNDCKLGKVEGEK